MTAHAGFTQYDWSRGTAEDQLALARGGTDEELRGLARRFDWNSDPAHVLRWVMAQKCIDLGTALSVFFNAEPERFNYVPKRDLPDPHHQAASLLDTICLRLNSGFYLVWPDHDTTDRARVARWMDTQAQDRRRGRLGRYVLDEAIVGTLLNNELRLDRNAETATYSQSTSIWRDIFSPVVDLGVSRRVLRYKPARDDGDDLSKLEF